MDNIETQLEDIWVNIIPPPHPSPPFKPSNAPPQPPYRAFLIDDAPNGEKKFVFQSNFLRISLVFF